MDRITKFKEYLIRRISREETYEDLLKFPRYLEIETINLCNARCPMCPMSDQKHGLKPMTDELYEKIAQEIIEHADEVKRVALHRNGEPLLDNKLARRIEILKKGGVKCVTISTNASLLTVPKAKMILGTEIDIVMISIDSLVKDTYEKIRTGLNFKETLDNIHSFIELRDKIRPDTKIWMRMIRQESNYNEWPDYQKYWKKYLSGKDRTYYHTIFNWGGQLKGFRPIVKSYEPNLPCVALWSLLAISCNGNVPLCNVDYRGVYSAGSVASHSIKEIWQSKIINDRRELHLTGGKDRISLCQNCNVWDESSDNENVSAQYAVETDIKT